MQKNNLDMYETDWLGSKPIYYNEKTNAVGYNINEVIEFENIEIDPEGFNNYLSFGYSVFGQTPLKYVKYLDHSSKLTLVDGVIKIEKLPDIVESFITKTITEKEILEKMESEINSLIKKDEKPIILPLSGGFDSRLLAYFLKGNPRVKTFTYGTSTIQSKSFEVVNAKQLASALDLDWQQIELSDFFNRIVDWEKIYGPATHAHGMYQLEFYDKIKTILPEGGHLISGIIGDAWAGSVKISEINTTSDVVALGYSHGMNADSTQSLLKHSPCLLNKYLSEKQDLLKDARWRVVESMRFKMVLLSYLLTIPSNFGFKPWSPFMVPEIAIGMLTLPAERRKNRLWQRDFFSQQPEFNLEKIWLKNRKNTLNLDTLRLHKLDPLNRSVLEEFIQPTYIDWINNTLNSASSTLKNKLKLSQPANLFANLPVLHSLPSRFKFDPYTLKNEESRALNAYLTLHPIQSILNMRR